MQSLISTSPIFASNRRSFESYASPTALPSSPTPFSLRFCGLRREVLRLSQLKHRVIGTTSKKTRFNVLSASPDGNGSPPTTFDYDLVIIGAGVGGHGAALHAVEKVRKSNCLDHTRELQLLSVVELGLNHSALRA
ncbi:hypothetical protein L1987_09350 [Smallanthus sonchifolius]|uniref:Uncharacterized protein n=1 Tax=Smallanthus sonchifolius TaxID=185202 RepID=A0ACB9JPI9_9ASTR|nr:hypothetical protein L1987_09350 [Smallanthus sonchifolius]